MPLHHLILRSTGKDGYSNEEGWFSSFSRHARNRMFIGPRARVAVQSVNAYLESSGIFKLSAEAKLAVTIMSAEDISSTRPSALNIETYPLMLYTDAFDDTNAASVGAILTRALNHRAPLLSDGRDYSLFLSEEGRDRVSNHNYLRANGGLQFLVDTTPDANNTPVLRFTWRRPALIVMRTSATSQMQNLSQVGRSYAVERDPLDGTEVGSIYDTSPLARGYGGLDLQIPTAALSPALKPNTENDYFLILLNKTKDPINNRDVETGIYIWADGYYMYTPGYDVAWHYINRIPYGENAEQNDQVYFANQDHIFISLLGSTTELFGRVIRFHMINESGEWLDIPGTHARVIHEHNWHDVDNLGNTTSLYPYVEFGNENKSEAYISYTPDPFAKPDALLEDKPESGKTLIAPSPISLAVFMGIPDGEVSAVNPNAPYPVTSGEVVAPGPVDASSHTYDPSEAMNVVSDTLTVRTSFQNDRSVLATVFGVPVDPGTTYPRLTWLAPSLNFLPLDNNHPIDVTDTRVQLQYSDGHPVSVGVDGTIVLLLNDTPDPLDNPSNRPQSHAVVSPFEP